MAGEHSGHRQRMRERFLRHGLDGFADHEVLELMLFYAIPQRNVNPLAHALIDRFGSLHGVLEASVEELSKVDGMGAYASAFLSLFSQVARRVEWSRAGERELISNRGMAERHCLRLLDGLREEHFYVVCLDGQMRLIKDVLIARGTLVEVPAYPRVVAEAVLRHNAHSVLLCHNHPGGSVVPSRQDVDMTRALLGLLQSIDVYLADHVIVAQGRALSMVGAGLIEQKKANDSVYTCVADSSAEVVIRARLEKQAKVTRE
ncbi:MAG: DNA repair protein RadC [Clostridiales bacterium]|nr:DNA repair protein RadC [Clostridiales bacterium]MDO4350490.1 DNA repair protein RadC [Eubacteriales bacterium]MDY4009055.1 DNA repair protein RadC [Candidatus Limiplasma sp.]